MWFDTALARLNGLGEATLALLPGLLVGLLASGLFLLPARMLRAAVARASRARGVAPGVGTVFGRIVLGLCLLLGGLVAAATASPSINAAGLFSALGTGDVAIGFAFRDIPQNALAGILILLTRPFRIGEQVPTGGYEGTVEDTQVRATTVRTCDNRRAVIHSTALFTDKVLVNTAFHKRRVSVRVSVGNGDDTAQAKRVVEAAARGAEGALADPPPRAFVAELGDSAVLLDVFFWVHPPGRGEALEATDRVLARVEAALAGAGINIPYPTMQVLLHDRTEATDGGRARQCGGRPARGGRQDPTPRWRVRDGENREVRPRRPNGAAGQAS